MKFDALVFDLDGTAIPKRLDGMPSPRLIEAVQAAKKICHVSVATGRPLELCSDVLAALDIDDLCVLNGGTNLYSRKTQQYCWKQEVDADIMNQLFAKLEPYGHYTFTNDRMFSSMQPGVLKLHDPSTFPQKPLCEYHHDEPMGLACIYDVTLEDAAKMLEIVKEFDSVHGMAVSGRTEGMTEVHISHELATKKHGLQSLLSRLDVHHDRVMVAGDAGNDIPLFELAGWKVAMGNATEELKALADWVAPNVEDDGLAVAIEKFVLNV